jgi:hypothetical protein
LPSHLQQTHSSVIGCFISDHGSSSKFITQKCALKPGFLGSLVFREGLLMVPYINDESVGIMCAVLNYLPLSLLIFKNENFAIFE